MPLLHQYWGLITFLDLFKKILVMFFSAVDERLCRVWQKYVIRSVLKSWWKTTRTSKTVTINSLWNLFKSASYCNASEKHEWETLNQWVSIVLKLSVLFTGVECHCKGAIDCFWGREAKLGSELNRELNSKLKGASGRNKRSGHGVENRVNKPLLLDINIPFNDSPFPIFGMFAVCATRKLSEILSRHGNNQRLL